MDIYTGTVERDKREAVGRVATAALGNVQCDIAPKQTQIVLERITTTGLKELVAGAGFEPATFGL
jgi:hypothetical protein